VVPCHARIHTGQAGEEVKAGLLIFCVVVVLIGVYIGYLIKPAACSGDEVSVLGDDNKWHCVQEAR
jgi:hypothetical protein